MNLVQKIVPAPEHLLFLAALLPTFVLIAGAAISLAHLVAG